MATTSVPNFIEELALAPAVEFIDPGEYDGLWLILELVTNDRFRLQSMAHPADGPIVAPISMLKPASREQYLAALHRKPWWSARSGLDPCDGQHPKPECKSDRCYVKASPVCTTCGDTHRMQFDGGLVACTRCPTPCANCRRDHWSAYCATTPCDCSCHQPTNKEPAMDPNATLKLIAETTHDDERREHVAALKEWLRTGGAEPDWDACPSGTMLYRYRTHAHSADTPFTGCYECGSLVQDRRDSEKEERRRARIVAMAADFTTRMRPQSRDLAHPDPTILAAMIVWDAVDDIRSEIETLRQSIVAVLEER